MGGTAAWTAAHYQLPLLIVVANNSFFYNDVVHQERVAALRAVEQSLGSTHAVTNALRDGAVDIALTAPEGSIADAVAGGPLRVVAGLIDRPPLSMIAIPRHAAFSDLRGGRIGTSSLTEGTRHVAERMLAAHGLSYPADYDFALEGSHLERWKALQAATIDAALQMIPYDDMATDAVLAFRSPEEPAGLLVP
jgi:ABC-type nitrate/sulfonate/bicarbonate transport system substrate-binding protein